MVQSQPWQIVQVTLSWKYPTQKRAGRVAQVVEHLPHNHEALNSNTSTTKKKKVWILGQVWWLIPVIPGTQEAEIRRITIGGQPDQNLIRPYLCFSFVLLFWQFLNFGSFELWAFELRVSCLLGKHSITWAISPSRAARPHLYQQAGCGGKCLSSQLLEI
jgi:hypothetical protein